MAAGCHQTAFDDESAPRPRMALIFLRPDISAGAACAVQVNAIRTRNFSCCTRKLVKSEDVDAEAIPVYK
jgi:hypothetical protein